jgi:hypothetical protein
MVPIDDDPPLPPEELKRRHRASLEAGQGQRTHCAEGEAMSRLRRIQITTVVVWTVLVLVLYMGRNEWTGLALYYPTWPAGMLVEKVLTGYSDMSIAHQDASEAMYFAAYWLVGSLWFCLIERVIEVVLKLMRKAPKTEEP